MKIQLRWYLAEWYLRIALSASFLVSLGDRFGILGQYGSPNVSWGNWAAFVAFSAKLTFWLPSFLRPSAASIATGIEIILSIALLIPIGTRWIALAAGLLLTVYAISMSLAYGLTSSFSYSIWTAAAGSFLLSLVSGADRNYGDRESNLNLEIDERIPDSPFSP